MASGYKELVAWQKAKELAKEVYQLTANFPESERYGLTGQIRRAAVSIPSNIAEGQGRLTKGEFRHFLGIARGSLYELETQLILATEMSIVPETTMIPTLENLTELNRILNGLIKSLQD